MERDWRPIHHQLFHDYVFHQVDERGRPIASLSHALLILTM